MERKAIAIRSSQYFLVKIYVTAMHIAGNFVIMKLFTVAGYGAYGFLFLILTYGASLHLGLENAFGKQYPVEIGKRDKSRACNIRDSSYTFSMMLTLAAMALIILFAIVNNNAAFEKRWAYILLAFTLPLQMLVEYYRTFFRVTKEFGRINVMELIYGAFEFVLRVGPVYYFMSVSPCVEYAFIGLFVGLFLTFAATIGYAYFTAPEKIGIRWNIPEVKYLYRLGIPIFICFLMDSLFKNGDKFMAYWFYQDEGMAYYLAGSQVAGLLYLVPFAVGWVIFPLMLQRYGETRDGTKVADFVFPPTSAVIQAILPLGAMMYLSLDFLIPILLAKYTPTILAAKILIPGMYFWCIVNMFMYFLIAMDDRKRMVLYQVGALILNLSLNWYFWQVRGMFIEGIALGTTISYFIYSVFLIHYTITKYFGSLDACVRYYLRLFAVQFLVFAVVVFADIMILDRFWADYFSALGVTRFFKWQTQLSVMNSELTMFGIGVFLIEMLCALLFCGVIVLVVRKYNLLKFKVERIPR